MLPASVLNKLARAKEHFDSYITEINREMEGSLGKFMLKFDFPKNYIAPAFIDERPLPPRIPLIIGDCLQNVRSSLDYLVWELIVAANCEPTERNAFPICETAASFEKCKKGKRLHGLTNQMIEEIEFLQPYSDGQEDFRGHPLWVLDELCNINKHRRILLTRIRPALSGRIAGTDRYQRIVPPDIPEGITEVKLVAYIAFEERSIIEGADVSTVLNTIISTVADVLPNFSRFFP